MDILDGTPDVRPAVSDYERRLDAAIPYYQWAQRGWTSAMVDGEKAWLIEAYEVIDDALGQVQERAAARNAAAHRAGQHLRR